MFFKMKHSIALQVELLFKEKYKPFLCRVKTKTFTQHSLINILKSQLRKSIYYT